MDRLRERAMALAQGHKATAAAIDRVARSTSPEAAAWAFTQWRLRERARAKFARADQMLFDADGLEMATHERLAAYHASRFPRGAGVADLTVGIGADLIALAIEHAARGFEIDADRAALAAHNLAAHGLHAELSVEDCLAAAWDFEYAFADPSRRSRGRRRSRPEEFQPNLFVLVDRMRTLRLGVVKLGPMVEDGVLEALRARVEFVSFGGECREALAYLGREEVASIEAVHVESGARLPRGDAPPASADSPEAWIFEADPAAIRAHALGAICREFGLSALGASNGYLTGARPVDSVWLRPWRVVESAPSDLDALKRLLRERQWGVSAVKSRYPGIDAEAFRRELPGRGVRSVILLAYPVGRSRRLVLVDPPS